MLGIIGEIFTHDPYHPKFSYHPNSLCHCYNHPIIIQSSSNHHPIIHLSLLLHNHHIQYSRQQRKKLDSIDLSWRDELGFSSLLFV